MCKTLFEVYLSPFLFKKVPEHLYTNDLRCDEIKSQKFIWNEGDLYFQINIAKVEDREIVTFCLVTKNFEVIIYVLKNLTDTGHWDSSLVQATGTLYAFKRSCRYIAW